MINPLHFTTVLLASISLTSAFTLPSSKDIAVIADHIAERDVDLAILDPLIKRKGGGGRSGSGGSSSSGSSSSGSSSSGSSSSGSSSSGSSGSRPANVGSTSNTGGSTVQGTGTRAGFSGGSYAGGSRTPFASGGRTRGGLSPFLLGGAALAFFPGLWLYGANRYNWNNDVTYHNDTANQDQSAQVSCLCAQYAECGCDENDDRDFIQSLIGNGSYAACMANGVVVLQNGASSLSLRRPTGKTLVINGTLANGTTAAGGTEDANGTSAAGFGKSQLAHNAGWWVAITVVGAMAYLV